MCPHDVTPFDLSEIMFQRYLFNLPLIFCCICLAFLSASGAVVGDELPGCTVIGGNNIIGHHAVVGVKCQDLKYKVCAFVCEREILITSLDCCSPNLVMWSVFLV